MRAVGLLQRARMVEKHQRPPLPGCLACFRPQNRPQFFGAELIIFRGGHPIGGVASCIDRTVHLQYCGRFRESVRSKIL